MVDSQIAFLVYRSQLKLIRGYLVVTCLAGYGQFERTYLEVFHECLHTVGDCSEIMVVHLLVLCAFVPHERAACEHQIGAGRIKPLVYEKVFLFPTKVTLHLAHFGIEIPADVGGSPVHGMQCTKQRGLIVKRLAGV